MATPQAPFNFNFNITFRHLESDDDVRRHVEDKVGGLLKGRPGLRWCDVQLDFESTRAEEDRYITKINLDAGGELLRVAERGPDPYVSVNAAREVLEAHLRDWKLDMFEFDREKAMEASETAKEPGPEPAPTMAPGVIVRRKSFEIKPMFPEDAVSEMEELGHDFFFFLNAGTGQYNVVYRRKAAGYGLIEPSLPAVEGA
jgi:putative sigma-54 modulation protein